MVEASAPELEGGERRRRRWRVALFVLVLLVAWDWSRPGPRQVSATVLVAGIDAYQATLSKAMPSLGVRCRFEPSCSRYAEAVIRRDGAPIGTAKTLWRILRCGPWTPAGTVDPP